MQENEMSLNANTYGKHSIGKEIYKSLLKIASLGTLATAFCSCDRPKAYPVGEELNQEAWLLNEPGKRSQFIQEGQLLTCLYLDTDGDKTTFEYAAMDLRSVRYVGADDVYNYRKAVDMLQTGECRTLAEWKKVAPNIVKGKYFQR